MEDEMGDIFFATVNLARWYKIDSEQALLRANKKFTKRFRKMKEIKKGDIVTRNSYNNDIIFTVIKILKISNNKKIALLKGIDIRIEADAEVQDLKVISSKEKEECEKNFKKRINQININKNNAERIHGIIKRCSTRSNI